MLTYDGANFFRQRIVLSILSGKNVCIKNIRSKDDEPGLQEHEANFIRLIDSISNGSVIEVNDTGTVVLFKPGFLTGGTIEHNCPLSRGIGYLLEPLIMLAPYCKKTLSITLKGVTNNEIDPTVDMIRYSLIPIIRRFLVDDEELSLKTVKRGLPPLGGGVVIFTCPVIRSVKAFQWLEVGKIKRIRGTAYTCRGPPINTNRMIEAAKGEFLKYLPDVYFTVDNSKGLSPGFGICACAETNKGIYWSAESIKAAGCRNEADSQKLPEDIGKEVAWRLMEEIWCGGCVDNTSQMHILLFMVLASRDVSKVLLGPLTTETMHFLRHIRDFFKVTFKIDEEKFDEIVDSKSANYQTGSSKLILTCVGTGFSNVSKPQI